MSKLFILDGGMGRELLRRGAPFRQPEWSAIALWEGPEHVSAVHEDYIRAGADMITTNSYAVVPFHIGEERFATQGAELLALSGRLAREAADRADRKIIVAGSLPPVLGSYRPDLYDKDAIKAILKVFIEALAPYVDVWLGETLSSTDEARAVREALDDYLPGDTRPLWLSFTMEDIKLSSKVLAGEREPVLRSGESLTVAAHAARDIDAKVFLFNCTQAEFMEPAIAIVKAALGDHPLAQHLGAYANTFVPYEEDETKRAANSGLSGLRGDLEPGQYADLVRRWAAAGASYAGGCCGIGPDHICAIHHDHSH